MNADRRVAFSRARRPVAVAMRVVAAALAATGAEAGARRSVFAGPRAARRVAARQAAPSPSGREDRH